MRKKIGIFLILLSLLLLGVLGMEGYKKISSYRENDMIYEKAKESTTEIKKNTDSAANEIQNTDRVIHWDKLKEYDVVSWLEFGQIDYPVVQGDDNQYYLNHAYNRKYNACGSIFMNANNTTKDRNLILYGHNVRSGKMFGTLKKYKKPDYGVKEFTLYFPDGTKKIYELFSVADVMDGGPAYQYQFQDDDAYLKYLHMLKDLSVYDTGVKPNLTKNVVTLSTCSDYLSKKGHRVIVVGMEKEKS